MKVSELPDERGLFFVIPSAFSMNLWTLFCIGLASLIKECIFLEILTHCGGPAFHMHCYALVLCCTIVTTSLLDSMYNMPCKMGHAFWITQRLII